MHVIFQNVNVIKFIPAHEEAAEVEARSEHRDLGKYSHSALATASRYCARILHSVLTKAHIQIHLCALYEFGTGETLIKKKVM